ncbi:hypothetical protein DL98DRAFT_521797 [Cadophora sp. DSE1049]|nr:hypothetical protein DL98DRAFT_521797 [Cadophora sp. DSE1049]
MITHTEVIRECMLKKATTTNWQCVDYARTSRDNNYPTDWGCSQQLYILSLGDQNQTSGSAMGRAAVGNLTQNSGWRDGLWNVDNAGCRDVGGGIKGVHIVALIETSHLLPICKPKPRMSRI